MSALWRFMLLSILSLGCGATTEDDIQTEVYIIAGVFGGITIILLLMVLGLAWTIARLNHAVKEAKQAGKPTVSKNPTSMPDMNANKPENYSNRQPASNQSRPRQPEHEDNFSYQPPQHAQDYYRGEDRTDRTSQYSWDPLPRRGEETRLPRSSYGQSRR
eukprot:TRINITY_DN23137_c0_g1_i3.p1 TRINITY_DN23137_c0_g1~~TRINITY_DN23137_c0_g1_i3.p1  ORF type:complete len:160 (-),score=27.93 TRINITY_DN23137_c0_g1_i3:73-552(-)